MTAEVSGAEVQLRRSSGGLASGLRGVHERGRGLWIGWPGVSSALGAAARRQLDDRLREAGAVPVPLDEDEIDGFYRRYANGVLWPALHELPPGRESSGWEDYRRVNERYAEIVARHARPGDRIWVHDYQLMLVPRLLRGRRPDVRVGFFLHTPFPAAQHWFSVEQGGALLDGVLGADVIGFHTRDYVREFLTAVRMTGRYEVVDGEVIVGERRVCPFACPIGIDVDAFAGPVTAGSARRDDERASEERRSPLFLGVDRLDYTKGIPERLAAFELLLERQPELRGRARLVQLAVPSREDVAGYRETRIRTEAIVSRINWRFGTASWRPVEYLFQSVGHDALVALYRAADVMLVTPLRDGMNLVAKEFVASRVDGDGVLVLSDRAGAAVELRSALLVDPTDVEGLASAYAAALAMSPAERRVRMRRLQRAVRGNDVFRWAEQFLAAMRV